MLGGGDVEGTPKLDDIKKMKADNAFNELAYDILLIFDLIQGVKHAMIFGPSYITFFKGPSSQRQENYLNPT